MLEALLPAGRVGLAAVFAVAAAAKLADRAGTREAVVAFGAPARLAVPLAVLLPLAELAVAGLLLPATTAAAGALGALALLAVFSGAIAVSLARGRRPECHCFGQLRSEPASGRTLARNGGLAVVAALVAAGAFAGSPVSAVAWIGDLEGAGLVAFVAGVIVAALAIAGGTAFATLLRSYGRVLLRLERIERALADSGVMVDAADHALPPVGLEPGLHAPPFEVPDADGEPVSLDRLLAPRRPLLLLFTSAGCGPCHELMPRVALWQRDHGEALTIAMAVDGDAEDARAAAREHGLRHVVVDEDGRLYRAFSANGTPSAVLVAPDATIASYVAAGEKAIGAMVAGVVATPGLPVGSAPPDLQLESLDGAPVALADLGGEETVLLFWNPSCGFCRGMYEDVVALESRAPGTPPRLVIVSSGDREGTRAERFRSTVLLDDHHAASAAFGADGTPMAVRLDRAGRVASRVAGGPDAVLALIADHGTRG